MTLVRHLVWSDARRFRWLLAGLMGLTALATALDGFMPELALRRQALESFAFTAMILWLAEGLLTALLVARVVQADRLVGTTAFWMTRPIAPATLFAAKAILVLAVAVAWPLFCETVLMAFHRVPPGQMVLGAVQDVGWRVLMALALMSAAALTANVTRFVVLCGSVVVCVAGASAIYTTLRINDFRLVGGSVLRAGGSTMAFTPTAYFDHTAEIIRVATTIVALLALVVVQYRYRSVRRSVLVGVAGVAIATVAAQFGPDSIVRAASNPPAWAQDRANLRLGVESGRIQAAPTVEWGLPIGAVKIQARAELAGIAPGWLAGARLVRAAVHLADGSRVDGLPFPRGLLLPDEMYGSGQAHVVKDVLGVTSLGDRDFGGGGTATLLVARREDVSRLSAEPVTYEGTFEIDLTNVRVASSLPLQPGATFQDGSFRLVLGDLASIGGALNVGVRHSELRSVFDRHVLPGYSYYLRNARKGEARSGVLLSEGQGHIMPFLFGLHLYRSSSAGFAVYPGQLRFIAREGQRHIEADLTEDWLRDAELVVLKSQYGGTVERTLRLENLEIPPPRRF